MNVNCFVRTLRILINSLVWRFVKLYGKNGLAMLLRRFRGRQWTVDTILYTAHGYYILFNEFAWDELYMCVCVQCIRTIARARAHAYLQFKTSLHMLMIVFRYKNLLHGVKYCFKSVIIFGVVFFHRRSVFFFESDHKIP